MGKKAAAHIGCVSKGILFIGFSIQIVLGIIWMCSNFAHVQDFGEPSSVFYGLLFHLTGKCPQVMYVLQLAAAFAVGYVLMRGFKPASKWFGIWGGLALVTFPFSMQTALAVRPYSFMGSLFLLMLYFLLKRGKKRSVRIPAAVVCVLLFVCLSGAVGADDKEDVWDYGWEASMASRMGWPSILNDRNFWSEELQAYTEETWWETTYCADNMVLLLDAIEEQVGEEKAKEYYLQVAEIGWNYRAPVVIRQMGWDVLGYTVTPLILPLQLKGEAYDSYSVGNYGVMREHAPALTRCYVEYGCWWFGCCLCLTLVLSAVGVIGSIGTIDKKCVRRLVFVGGVCLVASGVLVALLTLRGAGLMDYRWTVAVNQLWLLWGLWLMRRDGNVN